MSAATATLPHMQAAHARSDFIARLATRMNANSAEFLDRIDNGVDIQLRLLRAELFGGPCCGMSEIVLGERGEDNAAHGELRAALGVLDRLGAYIFQMTTKRCSVGKSLRRALFQARHAELCGIF